MILFSPNGTLNVAHDPSDLPETADENNLSSGAMVRCKNLRINQNGQAKTRDGSTKLNATAIDTSVWWIEVQGGVRYTFAGGSVYQDETSIETGLTSAQWSAIQYNAFNDTQLNIFALNGTDRKRIEGGAVYEWGVVPPTAAPTLTSGTGSGLTGTYNVRYTYVRKIGSTVVAESNPSPEGTSVVLTNHSLTVDVTQPTDDQVTHIRLYRTFAGGSEYFFDSEIGARIEYGYGYAFDWEEGLGNASSEATAVTYEYGVCFEWEASDDDGDDPYLSSGGYKWTNEDDTNFTENAYTWEERYTEDVSWDAAVSPTSASGSDTSSTVTTNSVTVTVTDPNGTPTYAWTKVSGNAISATQPAAATTSFIATGMSVGEIRNATFQCLVSDAPDSELLIVAVTCERTGSGGSEVP